MTKELFSIVLLLYSIICHRRITPDQVITLHLFVRHNNQWFKYNDEEASPEKFQTVRKEVVEYE